MLGWRWGGGGVVCDVMYQLQDKRSKVNVTQSVISKILAVVGYGVPQLFLISGSTCYPSFLSLTEFKLYRSHWVATQKVPWFILPTGVIRLNNKHWCNTNCIVHETCVSTTPTPIASQIFTVPDIKPLLQSCFEKITPGSCRRDLRLLVSMMHQVTLGAY